MTPWLLALAGGVGAALRFAVDGAVNRRVHTGAPAGTWVVNVLGSFLLGALTGWATARGGAGDALAVLGTGLLGGFTTFSTASVESVRLLRAGRQGAAAVHALGMLVAGCTAAALGIWLGSAAA